VEKDKEGSLDATVFQELAKCSSLEGLTINGYAIKEVEEAPSFSLSLSLPFYVQ
jgi:hypothetical protein